MHDLLGGSYKEITNTYANLESENSYEAHHIFAWDSYKSTLRVDKNDGPAIRMDSKADHQKTESWGSGTTAKQYREKQRTLLEQGKLSEAWKLEVKSIKETFSSKYDEHLIKAEAQLLKLYSQNKIEIDEKFKHELETRQKIQKAIDIKRVGIEKSQKNEYEKKVTELKNLEEARSKVLKNENSEFLNLYSKEKLTKEQFDKFMRQKVFAYPEVKLNFKDQDSPAKLTIKNESMKLLRMKIQPPSGGWTEAQKNNFELPREILIERFTSDHCYLKYCDIYDQKRIELGLSQEITYKNLNNNYSHNI